MSREQRFRDERGGALPGVVRDHPDLLQDDLLLLLELVGGDVEIEEDLPLVGQSEIEPVGRQGDLERREVQARIRVEIGAVPADVAPDLGPAPPLGPPEEDAVLEDVDEAARPGGLVLDADVDRRGDVDEGEAALFDQDDAQAVLEDEGFVARLRGRGGPRAGQQDAEDGDAANDRSVRPMFHSDRHLQQTYQDPDPERPAPARPEHPELASSLFTPGARESYNIGSGDGQEPVSARGRGMVESGRGGIP